jgi:3-phenylpropionate/trans-cinnamate dioxygenase ferredoxin reductase subunit
MSDIIIVGAGHAAGQAAASLRQEGFEGAITVIGDEPHLPYQRPPLSKQYLSGEHGMDKVVLRAESFYEQKDITMILGRRVTAIDRAQGTVTLDDGSTRRWDTLILATGSRVRKLPVPGAELPGVHYLRTVADVDGIRADMAPGRRMVIIGGGYIGLEVAAVAVTAGLAVTVLEMESRILQRVTTPTMSDYFHRLHTGHGVELRTGTRATAIEGDDRVSGVRVADDTVIPADVVLIGIGILPETELAAAAGLDVDDGIVVDETCRTSAPGIYAIGDCTRHPSQLLGRPIRLESVPNAMDQARVAAANIMGKPKVHDAVPWFWSDQYDVKLQMAGFSAEADREVIRGDFSAAPFAVFYLKGDRVIAVDATNSPREFMACKLLVQSGKAVDAASLADPEVDLKTLL